MKEQVVGCKETHCRSYFLCFRRQLINISEAHKLFNIMKPCISQSKRVQNVLISAPSLNFPCVFVTWLTKYGKVMGHKEVHDTTLFSRLAWKNVTKTMHGVHYVFRFFPDLHKSPAIMVEIEGKTHCSLIFEKYVNTTGFYIGFCC